MKNAIIGCLAIALLWACSKQPDAQGVSTAYEVSGTRGLAVSFQTLYNNCIAIRRDFNQTSPFVAVSCTKR